MKLANYYISNFKKNSLENFLAFFLFSKIEQKFFRIRKIFLTKKFTKKFLQKISRKIFYNFFTKNFSKIKIEKNLRGSKNFNARIIKNFIQASLGKSFYDKIPITKMGLYNFREIFNFKIFVKNEVEVKIGWLVQSFECD